MSEESDVGGEPELRERTREEKLESLSRRESVTEETRELARRALRRRREGRGD
ncbi:hypothetical protein NDI86_21825 [Halomicroarcula sp. S3CR25-11]|uniref:Uncharacterized protein n=1 Tax=Haloarcula onubensis TaxID=2950539 RepID=A0ABU2FVE7_9EURY|nr:hypothetical protein [Halomicroarcula sp. S3CR25-11]MDS0284745.1 hypothetical protein [Halomicroarcula sp. S3CR25-11]